MSAFNPATDIPDLSGKVCIVTGANSGLGEATVKALAQHNPRRLYLAARSQARAEAALQRIRESSKAAEEASIDILILDLSSFDSIRAAAERINREVDRIDILQLNAGVGSIAHALTTDGYEVHFGTNYLGHVLLTQLLMPKLLATAKLPGADVRIMAMSSAWHKYFAPREGVVFDQLKTEMRGFSGVNLYGQTNLCKTLFAHQFAKKYPELTIAAVHPGYVDSNIWNDEGKSVSRLFLLVFGPVLRFLLSLIVVPVDEGAKTQLWTAVSPDVVSGKYYEPVGKADTDWRQTADEALAEKLWEYTDKELLAHGGPGWATSDKAAEAEE